MHDTVLALDGCVAINAMQNMQPVWVCNKQVSRCMGFPAPVPLAAHATLPGRLVVNGWARHTLHDWLLAWEHGLDAERMAALMAARMNAEG